jgi:hypothetical protein|nr:MAG TPA: CHAP domain protein [Caudoviricetes sp.]
MANRFGFVDPNTYAKNVLKSIKYVATETAKGVNPTLTNYISDNVSAAKDMYYAVKDFKGTVRNELGKMVGEENLDSLKDVKKNILDDLKTGKFYNAEREDAAIGAFAESMGMTGFDFDDEDFDFDDNDNKEEESSSDNESSEITGAIHGLGNQLSYHQLITSEAVAGKIAGNATKNSRNMMLNNQRLFGMMNNSLSVINSSILNLHTDIVKPVNSLALNADTFFKQTSEEMAKQTKYLEDIKNLLTDRFSPKSTESARSRKQTPWEKVMGGDLPDLGEWGKFATQKFMEEYDLDSLAAVLSPDMINMLIKGGGLASPIATALTMSLTSKIQNGPTGKALDRTVSILRDGMMKIAGRMHEYAKGDGFFATIAKFLDITPKTKPKMDFGNYNKGRVDWTGKDSKALREVIPTYLANIEALLSGKEAKIFNYETGRFVTASRSVNDFKKKREEVIGNASRGMKRELINDFISEDNEIHRNTPGHISYTENSRAVRSLSKDYDKLMSFLTLKGVEPGRFHKTGDIVKFCVAQGWIGNSGDQSKYPMNYKSIVALDRLIFKKKSGVGKLYNGVYQGQLANAKFVDQISESDSTFSNIANGSGLANTHKYTNNLNSDKNNIFNVKDNLGNNVFFYLQDFYKNIRMMVDFQSAMQFDLDKVKDNIVGGKNTTNPPNNGGLFSRITEAFHRNGRSSGQPQLSSSGNSAQPAPANPSRSIYGFDLNQYTAPDNINIYANKTVKKPVTSEEVTERGFTVIDSEGRDVYNPETKQYEKPKAESRGSLLFKKNKAKEESTVGSFIIDQINDLMENFMFGDLGTKLKEQVDEDGGFFGYMLNLPSRISDAIYDFPERFAKKADELWKKFQETNFGEKYIKANKDILASFVRGTAQYADRQVDGTLKYIKEHFKIGKPKEEKPFEEHKFKARVLKTNKDGKQEYVDVPVASTKFQLPAWNPDKVAPPIPNNDAKPEGSYKGGQVRKSGMVSVSEGELIIPAKYNPMYHGALTDEQRKAIERRNYKAWRKAGGNSGTFFGSFAEGGTVEDKPEEKEPKPNDITEEQAKQINTLLNRGRSVQYIADGVGVSPEIVEYISDARKNNKVKEKINDCGKVLSGYAKWAEEKTAHYSSEFLNSPVGQSIKSGVDYGKGKLKEAMDYFLGGDDIYKDLKKTGNEIVRAAKVDLPKVAAAGSLGALAGAALTGSGLGLLGGLVLGSGAVIVNNSTALSEALFGKYDDHENLIKKGILPKGAKKFITEKVPDMGKAGALGAILGTIGLAPGGVMGGFVLGAGIELVKDTETFKSAMFGKEGLNGERHGGILGSIQTRVIDPLAEFTENGIEKIKNFAKKNFFSPIKRLFDPLTDWVKGKSKSIMMSIVDSAKDVVRRTIGEKFDALFAPVATAGKWIAKKALGVGKAIITAPFKLMGAAGDALKRHNINKGYSSLSAEERDDIEKNSGYKFFTGRKKVRKSALTDWELKYSGEERDKMIKTANAALNGPTVLKQEKHQIRQNLRDTLVGTLPHGGNGPDQKLAKSITKLMNYHKKNNNDYSDVIAEIENSNLDETTKKSMTEKIEAEVKRLNEIDADIKDYGEKKKTFFNESGLDISKMSKKELRRTRMQLRMDAAGIHKKEDAAREALNNKANVTPGEATTEAVDKLDIERNTILDTISDKISGILESLTGEKQTEEAESKEQKPATATEATIADAAKETSTTPAGVVPPENKEDTTSSKPSTEMEKKAEEVKKEYEKLAEKVAGENTKPKENNSNNTIITTDTIKEVMRLHNTGVNDWRIALKLGIEVGKVREIIRNNRAKDPTKKVTGDSSAPIQEGGESTGDNASSGDGNTKTVLDDEGNPIQYTRNTKGEWIANLADAVTNAAIKAKRKASELKDKFFGMFVGGNFFDKFKDIFGIGKTDEDGEKKSSILDFVKDKASGLFGKIFDGITSFLGGTFGKTIIAHLPTILGSAATIIGLSYLGGQAAGTDADSGMRKGMDPTERQKEVKGIGKILKRAKLGVDRFEISATGKKMTTYEQDDHVSSFFSDRFKKRIATNALLSFGNNPALSGAKLATSISKIPGIGKAATAISKTTFGKVIAAPFKGASKVGDVFKKGVDKLTHKAATKVIDPDAAVGVSKNAEIMAKIANKCKGAVRAVLNFVAKKLGKDTSWIDDCAEQIAQAIGKAGSKVTGVLSKIAGAIYIGQIALAVEDGFEDARAMSILGIIEKPTIAERCVAAAVNGINYAIPGIGGIISSTTIFNIVFNVLSRFLKGLTRTLADKRADAKATVEAYNQETGHTYNVEEYVYNVLGKSTTQDKFKSFVGKTVTNIKNFFTGKNKDTSKDDTKDNLSASKSNIDLNKEASGAKYGSGSGASQKAYQAKLAKAKIESSKKKKKGIFSFFNGSGSDIHTTQKGNFTKFGNSTIDQDGCGPAVASTVLKAFGKNTDITDTAKYAEKMGYVAGSTKSERGTNASYFGDILGRNGIDTKYTDNRTDINSAISSGKPTILLGEDDGNKSKTNSPFGPNPHYIVARGKDKNGNVIVDDPELKGTALYKKSILQKTKLGVVAGGDSDVDSSTASTTSNSGMDVSTIINTGISAGFNAIANKVGGTFGTIVNTIFNGFNNSSTSGDSSGYSYGDTSSSGGGYVYTGDSPFPICTEMPKANDPYISYYNTKSHGGQSNCRLGNPTDPTCSVLSNCVGWACGRFNHIYSIMKGEKTMRYRDFHADAGQMYALASKFGLQTGSTPQAGAIMVWASTVGRAGHVAVVEKVISSDELMDSESGFSSFKFKYKSRKRGSDGNWGGNSKYRFLGFVYNPAVQEYYASHNSVATPNAGNASDNAKAIWKRLKSKGMSETGISGLMGCWKNESNFNPMNLENKFEKKYGGDKEYTNYVDSNNKWPDKANDDVGYGLAQWTGANSNPRSGNRKHNLLAFAKSKGTSVGDLNTQVDFAYDELKNSGKYTKAYNNLMSAKTPADAAAAALGNYEMPSLGMEKAKTNKTWYPVRKKGAEEVYSALHGTGSALDRLDQEAIAVAARRSGSGSSTKNTKIPITHDFTNPNHSSTPTVVRKKALSRGSASDIDTVATTVNTSSLSDVEKLDIIIKYLEQITQNTNNNSSLPAIASILNGIINNMGSIAQLASSAGGAASSIGDINNSAQDIQNNIMEQLRNMKAKVEALASTP